MASIINSTTTAGVTVTGDNSGSLQLATNNGTTAVTIDTSQNVGIGVTPSAWGSGYKALQVGLNTSLAGNTSASVALLNTNAYYDGSSYKYITTDAATQYQQNTGEHIWRTAASGSAGATITFSDRMRITSGGELLVGVTSAVNSERLNVTQSGQFPVIYANNTNATNAYGIRANLATYFFNQTSFLFDGIELGNLRFRVYSDGGIANYSGNNVNLSDQREKKDIALAPNYLDKICQIPVKTFLYINQTDTQKTLGVIAQDVQAIAPELINETDWSADADGSKMRLSIYQTDLQYALMKAIQELKAELDATKAEVQALKGTL